MQQHFPPLRSKMQGTEKPQAGKVSCKKTNKEKIPCLPPKVEKGRTQSPPLEIEEAFAPSIRSGHVLAILDSYKVCRDGWRKKVEENWLLRDRSKEYLSVLKNMENHEAKGRRKAK
ncbi:UNVERIFIED_CONTAM: hypothetical protein H355_002329 [Colinus virginianus]|nr:hypothetical protein H355_002329 [Colinus virginianus]